MPRSDDRSQSCLGTSLARRHARRKGLELAEDLDWRLPDVVVYPTGGGTGLVGMWKAFAELEACGLIDDRRPRMVSVQAEGCAPLVAAFERGDRFAEP